MDWFRQGFFLDSLRALKQNESECEVIPNNNIYHL